MGAVSFFHLHKWLEATTEAQVHIFTHLLFQSRLFISGYHGQLHWGACGPSPICICIWVGKPIFWLPRRGKTSGSCSCSSKTLYCPTLAQLPPCKSHVALCPWTFLHDP